MFARSLCRLRKPITVPKMDLSAYRGKNGKAQAETEKPLVAAAGGD